MPTFNGARFVRRQIETIVAQIPAPDELVISDDGSTDDTLVHASDAAQASGIATKILSDAHVGLRRNMERALTACTGDVIVLADQDDEWYSGKLEAVVDAFQDEAVTLWFSDAEVVGAEGEPLGYTLWEAVHVGSEYRSSLAAGGGLQRLLGGSTVTGATMAFRRSVLDFALPLPEQLDGDEHLFMHDGWIALMAALMGVVATDARLLIRYRQHAAQVTQMRLSQMREGAQLGRRRALSALATHDELEKQYERIRLVASRLNAGAPVWARDDDLRTLAELEEFYRARSLPFGLRKSLAVLRQVSRGRYRRYARGHRTAAADLLLPR